MLYLAGIGGLFTAVFALLQEVDLYTLCLRVFVSVVIFASCGYIIGSMLESFLRQVLANVQAKGQHVDITNDDEDGNSFGDVDSPPNSSQKFQPLNTESFERIPGS
jgi:hypothetical protein